MADYSSADHFGGPASIKSRRTNSAAAREKKIAHSVKMSGGGGSGVKSLPCVQVVKRSNPCVGKTSKGLGWFLSDQLLYWLVGYMLS